MPAMRDRKRRCWREGRVTCCCPTFIRLVSGTVVHRACRRAAEMRQRLPKGRILGRLLRRNLQEPNPQVHPQVHLTMCHCSCLGVPIVIPWPHVHLPFCKHAAQGSPCLMLCAIVLGRSSMCMPYCRAHSILLIRFLSQGQMPQESVRQRVRRPAKLSQFLKVKQREHRQLLHPGACRRLCHSSHVAAAVRVRPKWAGSQSCTGASTTTLRHSIYPCFGGHL